MRVDHEEKSDGVRVHNKRKSDGVKDDHKKKSDGVRVYHKKERLRGNLPLQKKERWGER